MAADLRAFAAHGGWGVAVLTALTVQDDRAVTALRPIEAPLVAAQLRAALAAGPQALKTGMLATCAVLDAVADVLADAGAGLPLVVDPVLAASSGPALLEDEAVPRLAGRLGPHATLLTPNLPEAARLLGRERIAAGEEAAAARALCRQGWRAVLLKGGHAEGPESIDRLAQGEDVTTFARPRLAGASLRGTGCALSAAIAARLARGEGLARAVAQAGDWLHGQMRAALQAGHGRLPA